MIRSLLKVGDEFLANTRRNSLRVLGSVGEPINPEAWNWFVEKAGNNQAPLVDTWWQTETGAHMITPLPGAHKLNPGSASKPFFGVEVALLDTDGKEITGVGKGALCIKRATPGMARTIYGDHDRYLQTYFLVLMVIIFQVMPREEMRMVIFGSKGVWMMLLMSQGIEWQLQRLKQR